MSLIYYAEHLINNDDLIQALELLMDFRIKGNTNPTVSGLIAKI